jgi:hypothetical protein
MNNMSISLDLSQHSRALIHYKRNGTLTNKQLEVLMNFKGPNANKNAARCAFTLYLLGLLHREAKGVYTITKEGRRLAGQPIKGPAPQAYRNAAELRRRGGPGQTDLF